MRVRRLRPLSLTILLACLLTLAGSLAPALADHTPTPTSVAVAGNLQSELGCPGDWQPDCQATWLAYDDSDQVWQKSFDLPAGSWEYKAALNGGWNENYGVNATPGGANIPLTTDATGPVKFYYSHQTHWIADNKSKVIATVPGSFQSELGCPGDWQPDCLRSWLQDPDGDGLYTFTTTALPAGAYEAKVAINESWNENYGEGGAPGGSNIAFSVPTDGKEIFFSFNAASKVLTISVSGAPKGNLSLAQAHWVSRDTVAWKLPNPAASTVTLHVAPDGGLTLDETGVSGGQSFTLTYDPAGLSQAVLAKFPHLASYAAFKLPPDAVSQIPTLLKGQVAVAARDAAGNPVDATSLQIPGVLDELYTYTGALGVVYIGVRPTLKVWAPTARSVKLHLFDGPTGGMATIVPMTGDPATGVWSAMGAPAWTGKYYLYEVEVFVRETSRVERNLVTDPYSLSLSQNSRRSQIVNLADPALKPLGWDALAKPRLAGFEDIVLYELHIRDFSVADPTVRPAWRGKYLAFTEAHSNGTRHLRRLADAGLTHVHLLPTFDIATIEEDASRRVEPDPALLASYPPDSAQQQATIDPIRDQDGFNWGYDPYHYTVPEGSYATDPNGPARIVEFRSMVQGLNRDGLRVVLDVVYNHTNASGQSERSVLDKIVPGYYHRLNASGAVERSTCCENTATEHAMMEKLMIDSLVTWARDYKVDGFRFDLMGHHMKANMLNVRAALDALTLERDGVDGKKIFLYGEGWNFGEVADNRRGVNATQLNMPGTGIATFSDRLRDAVRGGGPFDSGPDAKKQGFINGLYYDPNDLPQGAPAEQKALLLLLMDQIRVGLAGNLRDYTFVNRLGATVTGSQIDYNGQPAGYTTDPQEVITYIEAHDNETLFDAIQMKVPATATVADRARMQVLGESLVLLGQGVPFFQAGQDLLRSKSGDRNSYNSGDWFNRLDWSYQEANWGVGLPPQDGNAANWPVLRPLLGNPALRPSPTDIQLAGEQFRELLRIRSSSPLFRLKTAAEVQARLSFLNTGPDQVPGLIVMRLSDTPAPDLDPRYEEIVVLFNALDETTTFTAASMAGTQFSLHPAHMSSADPVVRQARYDTSTGAFVVPARTTAVFVARQSGAPACDPANPAHVCNGRVVARAFIDYGCNVFFNPGTDQPLVGLPVTGVLPDGGAVRGVTNSQGEALLTGVRLLPGEALEFDLGAPVAPAWVEQSGLRLVPCPNGESVSLTRDHFGVGGVAYVNLRYTLTSR